MIIILYGKKFGGGIGLGFFSFYFDKRLVDLNDLDFLGFYFVLGRGYFFRRVGMYIYYVLLYVLWCLGIMNIN